MSSDLYIKYYNGIWYIVDWCDIKMVNYDISKFWKDDGVYFIIGGIGGLGFIFVKEIME